jgi:hypothetical protein
MKFLKSMISEVVENLAEKEDKNQSEARSLFETTDVYSAAAYSLFSDYRSGATSQDGGRQGANYSGGRSMEVA